MTEVSWEDGGGQGPRYGWVGGLYREGDGGIEKEFQNCWSWQELETAEDTAGFRIVMA